GGAPAMVAAAATPEAPPPPVVAAAPPPVVAAATPVATDPEASDANAAPSDSPETETAIAPLPPHKPAALLASLDLDAPVPPRRPSELTIASTDDKAAAPHDGDLIATLIESKGLPKAITKGVHGAPKSALALAESKSSGGGDADALARASALTPPPLPPIRPRFERGGKTVVEKEPPAQPIRPAKTPRPTAANPYGGLVVDAFNAAPPSGAGKSTSELRGTSP
ncbi:MAG: hypothetical protein KGM15_00385, partial [Pseudomonadota bacterium]|nr:hypothetical protein [Pseudomonadota bacterium]